MKITIILSPSLKLRWSRENSQLVSEMEELGLGQWFCEDIRKLVVRGKIPNMQLLLLNFVSHKMEIYFKMLGSGVKNWCSGEVRGTQVVAPYNGCTRGRDTNFRH